MTSMIAATTTALGAGIVLARRLGERRHARDNAECLRTLMTPATPPMAGKVRATDMAQLPAPVKRYFEHVLTPGQAPIRSAHYRQRGELRTDIESTRWMPFEAHHTAVPPARGFLWDARVVPLPALPKLHLRMRDAYAAGKGAGRISLQSAITLDEESASAEMHSGALMRYLAEAVWYPTALLPQAGVQWKAIDEYRALASLTHAGMSVSLEFRFNEIGEVVGIYTPGRWRRVGKGFLRAPWEGHFVDYGEVAGMRIPMTGEVGWHANGQWHPVWRAQLRDVAYVFAA